MKGLDSVLHSHRQGSRRTQAITVGAVGLIGLVIAIVFSISAGAKEIPLQLVWDAIFHYNPSETDQQIIHQLRLPRAIAAVLVGAGLALSGAMMQGMTRNPLADPSILGVTQGSSLAIAVAFALVPGVSGLPLLLWSFGGAGLGIGLVLLISSLAKAGLTPVKLALAGTAIGMLLSSLATVLSIRFQVAKDIAFWYAGGLAGTTWEQLTFVIPAAISGILICLFIARSVTILSFGDEMAVGLGSRTLWIKLAGMAAVLLMTGGAVSIAGTIGFLGLIVPHMTRALVGSDYKYILPCSAILGALLLVLADLGARMINPPYETPVSVVTALIGIPFFLYLARREGRAFQ
ncbi:FecCD family ABC transporter permease [Paenibacillus gansuensis]|uniref:FecCD family ABC transporter permease n=1 Tax=Paenibacillus gansuensis TaxID=306542 RepID=A0ABW5P8K4_9BACL